MKPPVKIPVRVSKTETLAVSKTETLGWAKMPVSVTRDTELSASAKVVMCELASWAAQGRNKVSRGVRAIASAVGMSTNTVMAGLQELSDRRHIRIVGEGQSRRGYVLLSKVFRKEIVEGNVSAYVEDGVVYKRLVDPVSLPRRRRA